MLTRNNYLVVKKLRPLRIWGRLVWPRESDCINMYRVPRDTSQGVGGGGGDLGVERSGACVTCQFLLKSGCVTAVDLYLGDLLDSGPETS